MFNAATFWANRPASISPADWITHPRNDQALPKWTGELVRLIKSLGRPETYFHQKWLIPKVRRSIRQIKEMISRLKKIGLIATRRTRLGNRMSLTALGKAPALAPAYRENKNKDTKINVAPQLVDAYRRYLKDHGKYIPFRKWLEQTRDLRVGA